MAKSKISESLLQGSEENISKNISVKDIVIGILLVAAGMVMFVVMRSLQSENTDTAFFALGCGAIIFVIWGCLYLGYHWRQLCYNKSALHGYVIYVQTGSAKDAIRFIEEQNWDALAKVVSRNETNVKIDFVASRDKQFARCQVLTYVPHQFEPMSDLKALSPEGADALLKLAK